jgi:CheY-like chemotaxis protein
VGRPPAAGEGHLGMGEQANSYLVHCHKCGRPFDAWTASWCRCVAVEPSLVCPNCGECLCRALQTLRQTFWSEAPAALRRTRALVAERNKGWLAPDNPLPSEVRRPLVLVVEDDRRIHQLLTDFSEGVDRTLIGTLIRGFDGREGLQLARRYRPNLVLADVLMPKLDGREMCRLIKSDPSLIDTKVVLLTGLYTSPRDQMEGMRIFLADDYLTKPFSFSALQALLLKQLSVVLPDRRQSPRFEIALKVRLSWTHPSAGPREEQTVTANLSKGGALVPSSMPVAKGDMIFFEEADGRFKTRASIQRITIGADNIPRLSLHFLDAEAPDRLLPGSPGSPQRQSPKS